VFLRRRRAVAFRTRSFAPRSGRCRSVVNKSWAGHGQAQGAARKSLTPGGSLAFLLLVRFPLGVAGFVVLAASLGTAVQLMLAPLQLAFDAEPQLGPWKLDTWAESAAACLLGVALIIPALQLARLSGWLCGRVQRLLPSITGRHRPSQRIRRSIRAVTSRSSGRATFAERFGGATFRERQLPNPHLSAHFRALRYRHLVLLFINGTATSRSLVGALARVGLGHPSRFAHGLLAQGHLGATPWPSLATNAGLFIIDSQLQRAHLVFLAADRLGCRPGRARLRVLRLRTGEASPRAPRLSAFSGDRGGGLVHGQRTRDCGRSSHARGTFRGTRGRGYSSGVRTLALLTAEPGRPFSREELLDCIWKDEYEVTDRTIDTHVQRLRKEAWAQRGLHPNGLGIRLPLPTLITALAGCDCSSRAASPAG
jgi:hypothetical protein